MFTEPERVVFPVVGESSHSDARHRGYTQGHAAGYAEGMRAAAVEQARIRAQLQAELAAERAESLHRTDAAAAVLAAAAAAFQQRFRLVLQDAESVLAVSAVELAEAVLRYEFDDGERTARAALRRALSAGGGGPESPAPVAVRLHPADIAVLETAGVEASTGVELIPDSSLTRGDAVAHYPAGWLDARVGAALSRARAALLGPELLPAPGERP